MPPQLFARAKPSNIRITETYHYYANVSGNPTLEERGEPQGEILVELPLDGHQYFTRQAYADVRHKHQEVSGDISATMGHLAFSGISPEAFCHESEEPSPRQVLKLNVPVPGETERLGSLIEDRRRVVARHMYRPKWPEVYPRPRPLTLEVDLYDEHSIQKRFWSQADSSKWSIISQELSFERSLFFDFQVGLALPSGCNLQQSPVIKLMRMEWPVATSYHMLELYVKPIHGGDDDWPKHNLYYVPEEGSVEWRDIEFRPVSSRSTAESETAKSTEGLDYQAPVMLLKVREPGELYRKPRLICRLEVELPGVLLSNLNARYFDVAGFENPDFPIEKKSILVTDIEINLEQRFNRKILSPLQHLQFEGVILEDVRMLDISTLLKDLGFQVDPFIPIKGEGTQRVYALSGSKTEGSDDKMRIWIVANGKLAHTERETIIPGGKTFKTTVESGNMELDMRAELRGNVKKLTRVLNTVHTSLKERFRHVSTLE